MADVAAAPLAPTPVDELTFEPEVAQQLEPVEPAAAGEAPSNGNDGHADAPADEPVNEVEPAAAAAAETEAESPKTPVEADTPDAGELSDTPPQTKHALLPRPTLARPGVRSP